MSVCPGVVPGRCHPPRHLLRAHGARESRQGPVWGKASPGEEVTVKVGDQTATAKAGQDGAWKAVLDLSKSGPGPFVATVKGNNEITIPDVVVGEVWVASGQSNMEWVLDNTIDAQKEIANSSNPMLRQFRLTKNAVEKPTTEFTGKWEVAGRGPPGNSRQ